MFSDVDPMDAVALLAPAAFTKAQVPGLFLPVDGVSRVEVELGQLHKDVWADERILLEIVARTGCIAGKAFHTGEKLRG